jgi:hydrogenase 3 maturation protease
MSKQSWPERFRQTVASLPANGRKPRVAVVGIGHELRGDDAAGVTLVRLLKRWSHDSSLLVIEAGLAPENCCGLLFRCRPDLVLLVDAADMGTEPGTVRWLDWQDVTGPQWHVSTHTLPLDLLATYLTAGLACPVALLGIQVADVSLGAALTPAVKFAVEATARQLVEQLSITTGGAEL